MKVLKNRSETWARLWYLFNLGFDGSIYTVLSEYMLIKILTVLFLQIDPKKVSFSEKPKGEKKSYPANAAWSIIVCRIPTAFPELWIIATSAGISLSHSPAEGAESSLPMIGPRSKRVSASTADMKLCSLLIFFKMHSLPL